MSLLDWKRWSIRSHNGFKLTEKQISYGFAVDRFSKNLRKVEGVWFLRPMKAGNDLDELPLPGTPIPDAGSADMIDYSDQEDAELTTERTLPSSNHHHQTASPPPLEYPTSVPEGDERTYSENELSWESDILAVIPSKSKRKFQKLGSIMNSGI